jgi:hypothetical protein
MGLGGSVFQWHPELKIGFGYTITHMLWFDVLNTKAAYMQKEVADCAAKLQEK